MPCAKTGGAAASEVMATARAGRKNTKRERRDERKERNILPLSLLKLPAPEQITGAGDEGAPPPDGQPTGSGALIYSGFFAPSLPPFTAPVVVFFVLCQTFFVTCFVPWTTFFVPF